MWKPRDGVNPFSVSPPEGFLQRNARSGYSKDDPKYMENVMGTLVIAQCFVQCGATGLLIAMHWQVCGKWQITGYLSEGGFGRGWKGKTLTTGQPVFLKTFRSAKDRYPNVDPDQEANVRKQHEISLKREIEALEHARVSIFRHSADSIGLALTLSTSQFREATDHPSIAKLILCYGRAQLRDECLEGLYCVMSPDLAIGDLYQFLCPGTRVRSFNPNEAKHLFRMIGNGVAFLHDHRLYHRDLKFNNIVLVGEEFDAKIIDFGSAKFAKLHVQVSSVDDQLLTCGPLQ